MRPTFHANNELALHVADPARAVDFYANVLGCLVEDRAPDCITLRSGALRLYLLRPIGPHAPGEYYVRDPFGVLFDVIARPASDSR